MYLWQQLNPKQREDIVAWRRHHGRPWHSPPRLAEYSSRLFHLTAACYGHAEFIGYSPERISEFTRMLLDTLADAAKSTFAWCVLPNHYHLLVETWNLRETTRLLGRLHGRCSRQWNLEEGCPGRTCFHRTADRAMRSDRHFWATLNYIHHNPVHHGLAGNWNDWPWGSGAEFVAKVGKAEATRIWREYPLLDYGRKWDSPEPVREAKPTSHTAALPPEGGTTSCHA